MLPNYGTQQQYMEPEDEAPKLKKYVKTFVYTLTGTSLYYAGVVNIRIVVALSDISLEQENPTNTTMKRV